MGVGDEELAMARARTSKNSSLKFEWARSRPGKGFIAWVFIHGLKKEQRLKEVSLVPGQATNRSKIFSPGWWLAPGLTVTRARGPCPTAAVGQTL